jgi:hypothetical protein
VDCADLLLCRALEPTPRAPDEVGLVHHRPSTL